MKSQPINESEIPEFPLREVESSKCWMFRSGFSTTCNSSLLSSECAAGGAVRAAAPAYLSTSSFMFVTTTAMKNHIPAIMFWKWIWRNEIFISMTVPWHILTRHTCDQFREEKQPVAGNDSLPNSLWWGMEEGEEGEGGGEDKSCWSSESRFISLLLHHQGPQVNLISGFSHCADN